MIFNSTAKTKNVDERSLVKQADHHKKPTNLATLTEGIVSGPNAMPPQQENTQCENAGDGKIIQKELRLSEIGFMSSQVDDFDKISQPRKKSLIALLKVMIDNYVNTDVVISIGDRSFNCHLMVLQCYSRFFMSRTNEDKIYLPPNKVSPTAFVMVYDWMLTSEPKVHREGLLQLFIAAQFLQIDSLIDQCWVCLDDYDRFREDAAFLLYVEAREYKLQLIMDLMFTRICKFFIILVASKEFVELDCKEVSTLLKSNSIGVNSESEVLMVAVRWLNYDWNNRQKSMLEIIECVRFGLMPPWFLVDLKRNNHCRELQKILDNKEVIKMIDDGLS